MSQKRIQQIEPRIDRIKRALREIGPMRCWPHSKHPKKGDPGSRLFFPFSRLILR